jgi:hypothetical protein
MFIMISSLSLSILQGMASIMMEKYLSQEVKLSPLRQILFYCAAVHIPFERCMWWRSQHFIAIKLMSIRLS